MKSFLLKCVLFCLPIVLVYGCAFSILVIARELTSLQDVMDTQQRYPDTIVNFGYGNYTKHYKALMTERVDPDIIAIGTSRSMEFRSGFFSASTAFYNAAGMDNPSDLVGFIRQLPTDSHLRTIIVGIDPRYLQMQDANSAPVDADPLQEQLHEFFPHTAKNIYTDYYQRKYSLAGLIEQRKTTHNIGMIALASKKGFRVDGSYDHGPIAEDDDRIATLNGLIADRVHSLQDGGFGIGYDDELSQAHLKQINAFLEECRSRHITVVGFLPPSPGPLLDVMRGLTDGRGKAFRELPLTLSKAFNDQGYHFYDLSDLQAIGSTTTEMLDVEHTSEKGSLRILSYLAGHEPALGAYVTTSTIQGLLARPSHIRVF